MEMSEINRAPDSDYETVPRQNREDEYETLHFSKRVKNRTAEVVRPQSSQKKFILLLLSINSLALTAILVLVALNSLPDSKFSRTEPKPEHVMDADPEREVWHLHRDEFYIIWRRRGTCENAEMFCLERGAQLATVDHRNEEWMRSQARGQLLWVKTKSHAFVSGSTEIPDQEDCQCELFPDHDTSKSCEDLHSWACLKSQNVFKDL